MFTTIIRTLILYVLVMFSMRIMGKRQIGDMQPAELVVTLLISEIAAIPIQDSTQPVLTAVVAIFTLVAFELVMTVITLKSNFINNLANGKSAMIIEEGKVLQSRLEKLRVTVADLMELLREQGIFDLNEVEYAILETDGSLSVLQKPQYRNARVCDVNGKEEKGGMPSLVISDGTLLPRGLEEAATNKEHIMQLLKKKKVKLDDVFIMTVDRADHIVLIKKEKKK